jgi:hypothetical protein
MKNKTKNFSLLGVIFLLVQSVSCDYDFVEVEQTDIDVPVKFSETIQAILSDRNCITCHHSDYTKIDLSVDKAYATIVPHLIDTLQPELSKIYSYPNPGTAQHQFKKYTPAEAAQVLTWIIQGAKNN